MKQVMKRLTALLLVGIMVISMIPELTVKAAGNANIQCVFKCGANVTGVLDITGTLTLTGTGSTYEEIVEKTGSIHSGMGIKIRMDLKHISTELIVL